MNENKQMIPATCQTMTRTINGTTYIVSLHFNKDSRETLDDKLKRLLEREIRHLASLDNRET